MQAYRLLAHRNLDLRAIEIYLVKDYSEDF